VWCRYISHPIVADQPTQLVPGGSSDSLGLSLGVSFRGLGRGQNREDLDAVRKLHR